MPQLHSENSSKFFEQLLSRFEVDVGGLSVSVMSSLSLVKCVLRNKAKMVYCPL